MYIYHESELIFDSKIKTMQIGPDVKITCFRTTNVPFFFSFTTMPSHLSIFAVRLYTQRRSLTRATIRVRAPAAAANGIRNAPHSTDRWTRGAQEAADFRRSLLQLSTVITETVLTSALLSSESPTRGGQASSQPGYELVQLDSELNSF